MSGVQRYAEGLAMAIEQSDIEADFAGPGREGKIRGLLWEQRTLPRLSVGYDALLCPANMAPALADSRTRLLVTVHCLRFKFHPSSYPAAFVRWYSHMIPRIIERADTVFTVSQAQRSEIESVYPASIGKIELMPPGLDPVFHPGVPRDKKAPPGKYLVSVTSPAPAKNLSTLIKAYQQCTDLPPLVLIGVSESEADLICPQSVRDRVVAMGYIKDASRIASLIAHADMLLAPSRYESFGLPCLEAIGCATPVIASDIPAHREVCCNAGVYADPSDPEAWVDQMRTLLDDPQRRERMQAAGLRRSEQFRWETSVEILNRVLCTRQAAVTG